MTTREYVETNFRSNDNSGLAFLAELLEKEDWSTEALERIVDDAKLDLPAMITYEYPGVVNANGWTMFIEDGYIRDETNEIGIAVKRHYPSSITVTKPYVERHYNHDGSCMRMVYKCSDRSIEARYWAHMVSWDVSFYGGKVLSIEVDDTRHHYDFTSISREQILACELALNLISEQESVTEETYKFITETLGIVDRPISRFYMAMKEKRDDEHIGMLQEKLLYIDGKMEERAVTAGDMTFLKFSHGLKKVYGRGKDGTIFTITFPVDGEVTIDPKNVISDEFLKEIIGWAGEVFTTF